VFWEAPKSQSSYHFTTQSLNFAGLVFSLLRVTWLRILTLLGPEGANLKAMDFLPKELHPEVTVKAPVMAAPLELCWPIGGWVLSGFAVQSVLSCSSWKVCDQHVWGSTIYMLDRVWQGSSHLWRKGQESTCLPLQTPRYSFKLPSWSNVMRKFLLQLLLNHLPLYKMVKPDQACPAFTLEQHFRWWQARRWLECEVCTKTEIETPWFQRCLVSVSSTAFFF